MPLSKKSIRKANAEAKIVAKRKKELASGKVLLLRTPDARCFFTYESNYPLLVEFARSVKAEISIVKMPNPPVLEIEELAPSICSAVPQTNFDYEVIETKVHPSQPIKRPDVVIPVVVTRTQRLNWGKEINKHIMNELLAGETISTDILVSKFASYNLPRYALSRYIRRSCAVLVVQGHKMIKDGSGVRLTSPNFIMK